MKLEGKVSVVTGATAGIGRAIAQLFASEGSKVVVVGRNEERGAQAVEECREAGGEAIFIKADVSEADEMKNVVDMAVKTFGKIDIMVNNAGSIRNSAFLGIKVEDFDYVIKNDLRSAFLGCKFAGEQMVKQGHGGRIINLSSIHAKISEPLASPYTAAKSGVEGLTKTVATELAPYHITVNMLAPGATYTPFTIPMYTPAVKDALMKRIPLRAIAEPKDIACGALFIASDEAWYMTGARLCIDGGYEMDGSLPGASYWSE